MLVLIDKAAKSNPDIIVLSESLYTRGGDWEEHWPNVTEEVPGNCSNAIAEKANQYGCYIVFNLNAPDVDGVFRNANFLMSPEGKIVGRYNKNKVPGSIYDEDSEIWSGLVPDTERPVFDIDIRGMRWTVGMEVCWDLDPGAYKAGEERVSTTLANKGADLILISSIGDYTYEAMQDAKNENVYVVIAGQDKYRRDYPNWRNTDMSAIIDPSGNILAQVTDRTADQSLEYEEMMYRYGQDGSYVCADIKK